jgi:hypothetical protein
MAYPTAQSARGKEKSLMDGDDSGLVIYVLSQLAVFARICNTYYPVLYIP